MTTPPKRSPSARRVKFSLSFLLVVVLISSMVFSWFRWSRQESLVHDVVAAGNASVVQSWANRRPRLLTNNRYYSPSVLLRAAVESGSHETLEAIAPLILENTKSKDVFNALPLAIRSADLKGVEILLKSGLDPNANPDFPALVEAKKQASEEMIRLLLEHGAKPTIGLAWACSQPDTKFAYRMLSLGALANTEGALRNAVTAGNFQLAETLLEDISDTTEGLVGLTNETPSRLVKRLLDHASLELSPIEWPSVLSSLYRLDDSSVLEQVAQRVSLKTLNPIDHLVSKTEDVRKPREKIKILLNNGATVTSDILWELASHQRFNTDEQQMEIFEFLFAHLNAIDPGLEKSEHSYGNPISACTSHHAGFQTQRTSRALQYAMAKILLKAGVADHREFEGTSPLHNLAFWEFDEVNKRIAQELLDRGVHVDSQDNHGVTPLNVAARNSNLDLVKFFIEAGADPTISDNSGQLPVDVVGANTQSGVHPDAAKIRVLLQGENASEE